MNNYAIGLYVYKETCYLTCEATGTTAGELVDLVHTHTFIQTGGGDALVHLRLTERA